MPTGSVALNSQNMKRIIYIVTALLLISCNKEIIEPRTQVETLYDRSFTNKFGDVSGGQEWGDWSLTIPAQTRNDYRPIDYPSMEVEDSIVKVLGTYYDGINLVDVPEGEYWVKTIYKNDYNIYTDRWYNVTWFTSASKMSNVSSYDQTSKSYVPIQGLDSIVKVKIDGYDGVMPQFAYYNELFSENHYEQLIVEHEGIYYVGFDFYADGFIETSYNNGPLFEIHDRDYVHNDWIIMLIPARVYGDDIVFDEKRVLCEYMTSSPDFDFNDLVYDVAIVDHKDTIMTRITIQAVGFKESMNIAGREVHSVLGIDDYSMANTGGKEGQKRVSPGVIYIHKLYDDIRDIDVSMFVNNKLYFFTCNKGEPPKRICVNKDFKWCAGEIRIDFVYPDFPKWVRGEITDWEKNYRPELVFRQ